MAEAVTALVCTRNRPAAVVRALKSLLAGAPPALELIVVDQSDGDETRAAVGGLSDARIRYLRSRRRGKGAALNEGLRAASGPIVACTDDDCQVPPGWAERMAERLKAHPSAALTFCNVVAASHDSTAGYVPDYVRRRSRLVRRFAATIAGHGLGAGMALRREIVLSLGGFDEAFGPGARFPSGDDWDIAGRLLLSGWHVYEAADIFVTHDGFRTFSEGREHARRDWIAIGAVCAKLLRARRLGALVLPLWEATVHALLPPLLDLLRLRRPRGKARIAGFAEGFLAGLRIPVDRRTLLFERPPLE